MLCKYFTQFGRVVYNSLEEGFSPTMQRAFMEVNMREVGTKLILAQETMDELNQRLLRKKSPQVAVTDSVQYTGMNYREYTQFKDMHYRKTLIFISHANGKEPKGNTAQSIRYDASVKVFVEGYIAFPTSRYGGGKPFVIWPEGARDYWGLEFDEILKQRI